VDHYDGLLRVRAPSELIALADEYALSQSISLSAFTRAAIAAALERAGVQPPPPVKPQVRKARYFGMAAALHAEDDERAWREHTVRKRMVGAPPFRDEMRDQRLPPRRGGDGLPPGLTLVTAAPTAPKACPPVMPGRSSREAQPPETQDPAPDGSGCRGWRGKRERQRSTHKRRATVAFLVPILKRVLVTRGCVNGASAGRCDHHSPISPDRGCRGMDFRGQSERRKS